MFEGIGRILDNWIKQVRLWNTQRIWYKPYAYIYTISKIKSNKFRNLDHLTSFLDRAWRDNQIYNWQYRTLRKKYLIHQIKIGEIVDDIEEVERWD